MKSLAVQFLASIIVFISLSFSKEDGEGRDHPTYVVFDKKISIKEIIRFGGIRDESHGEMEAPHEKKNLGYLLSQLLANASEAVTLGDDNADNNTGTAVVCGTMIVLWTVHLYTYKNTFKTHSKTEIKVVWNTLRSLYGREYKVLPPF